MFVPGLLVLLAIFGGLFQGFGLIAELRAGVIERSRVTPVSRFALLLGRSLRDVVSLIAQAGIITILALFFDLRVFIGDLLLAYLMLALIALMTSAVSYGVALAVKSEDALAPLMNTVAQPVLLLSGILLPLQFAPGWLEDVAKWNPFSWAVDGTRALFAGDVGNDKVWQGLLIVAVLTVLVGLVGGTRIRPQRALISGGRGWCPRATGSRAPSPRRSGVETCATRDFPASVRARSPRTVRSCRA